MKPSTKHQLIRFYSLSTLGLALLIVAISPTTQAQPQPTDPSDIPAQPTPEPADQIPEVFTPQVPNIEQDTIQLQQQLEQDNIPSQGSPNGAASELNQINSGEQQLEQNDQEQLDHVDQPGSAPSSSHP